ncbi:MAG: type II toxin-antitoxin system PemK/MazF family toxin [Rhodospirillaceae bacterium]|nr:type II toxin-antitoxin system PemK/MazF family toxin [Rhodospirillaceae bacterium]
MKRGEIWTVAGGKDYAGKPRPVVIVQDDRFDATNSIFVCSFTRNTTVAELFRIPVRASSDNGLKEDSRLMVDKMTSVPKSKLGRQIGVLEGDSMTKLELAILTFLGIVR